MKWRKIVQFYQFNSNISAVGKNDADQNITKEQTNYAL